MPQSQVIAVKGVEPKLVQIIMDEIVEGGAKVQWTDIAGQEVSSGLVHIYHILYYTSLL